MGWLAAGAVVNVLAAVVCTWLNKIVLRHEGFSVFTLSIVQSVCSLACLAALPGLNASVRAAEARDARLPVRWRAGIALASVASIVFANLSLQANPLGTYQFFKLLIIPLNCLVESLWCGLELDRPSLAAVAALTAGTYASSARHFAASGDVYGLTMACLALGTSLVAFLLIRALGRQGYAVSSTGLIRAMLPFSLAFLALCALYERSATGAATGALADTAADGHGAALALPVAGSALASGLILVSGTYIVRVDSALSYHVLSNIKHIIIAFGSIWLFGERSDARTVAGYVVAFGAASAYGYFRARHTRTAIKAGGTVAGREDVGGPVEKRKLSGDSSGRGADNGLESVPLLDQLEQGR